MENKPLILKNGKVSRLPSGDMLTTQFSFKRIENEVITIHEKKQMIVCGDFKIIGTAELVILSDGEFTNIKG